MKTRNHYINGDISHNDYYDQFVNRDIIRVVERRIRVDKIKKSTCEHFNDIPLKNWDNISGVVNVRGFSLSDRVCTLKAAARQIKEVTP